MIQSGVARYGITFVGMGAIRENPVIEVNTEKRTLRKSLLLEDICNRRLSISLSDI